MKDIQICSLTATPEHVRYLSDLLIETVTDSGSDHFVLPLLPQVAQQFWETTLSRAEQHKCVVLGAWDGPVLTGTITLLLDFPPNQKHRAELVKMMTRPGYREQGIATALLRAAETLAREQGRTLLMLGTASGGSGPYEKLGYVLSGEIPAFAFKSYGGLNGTQLYWKHLDQKA